MAVAIASGPGRCYRVFPVSTIDLLTLGEAFEDLIFVGLERLPKPGEEVKTSEFVATIGGGAVITSVAAARLGLACEIRSGLSEDAARRLRAERVKVGNLRKEGEPHAITAALSTRANRSFVTFNGINDLLEPRLLESLDGVNARHVHFAFFPHDCGSWLRVVERLREDGITTSWDFGWNEALLRDRRFPVLVNALDFVFINEQEAVLYSLRLDLRSAVDAWRAHPHNVIIKLGAKGSQWLSATTDVCVPPARVKVVDTTGAGDAFNGGFLAAFLRGASPKTCLRVGNFVGAMSTRVAGGLDSLPRGDEVPDWEAVEGRAKGSEPGGRRPA